MFCFHHQAKTKIMYPNGDADHLCVDDPIVMDEKDGSYLDVTLTVKVWAQSKFRDWAKKCKLDGVDDMSLTVITSAGEKYEFYDGKVINTGGFVTGGPEGVEHSIKFKFDKVIPITEC